MPEKTTGYKCPICGMNFNAQTELKGHEKECRDEAAHTTGEGFAQSEKIKK